jgi:hypothetical protein
MPTWKQITKPNTNIKGRLYFCLKYVCDTFGIGSQGYGPDGNEFCAKDAWNVAKGKHAGKQPAKGVAVPCYFSYTCTIDGVRKDWGHIVWSDGRGNFYSSPMKVGETRHIFKSTNEVLQWLPGSKYLGCSEYLGRPGAIKQIVKKVDTVTTSVVPKPKTTPKASLTTYKVIDHGQRVVNVNVRKNPSLKAAIAKDTKAGIPNGKLKVGDKVLVKGFVTGDSIFGDKKWAKTKSGYFVSNFYLKKV